MKRQLTILLAAAAAVGVMGGEFYRMDLSNAADGSVWVHTDSTGRVRASRPAWGMWPRDPARVGAEVEWENKQPLLRITKGFQVDNADWSSAMQEACQSTVYAQFEVRVPRKFDNGVAAVISMQQINNRAGAFWALIAKQGKLELCISNGDGKGRVSWRTVAPAEFGKWLRVDIAMDCRTRRSSISLDGGKALDGNVFRHAETWEGTMWPRSLKGREYRCDFKADQSDLQIRAIRFSSDPFPAAK